MAEPCADMECSLKVHASCESCIWKTHDVLRSFRGVFDINWDARENILVISGEVNPNVLWKAVSSLGGHAELVNVKLKHPQLRFSNYSYPPYGPTVGNYQMPLQPYRDPYRSSLSSHPYYQTNDYYYPYGMPREPSRIDYAPYNTSYNYQNPLPSATYVPSLPYQEYNDPYNNYVSVNPCSIM